MAGVAHESGDEQLHLVSMAPFAGSIATVLGKWRLDHLIFVVKGVAPDFRCLLVRRSFLLAAHTGVLRQQR